LKRFSEFNRDWFNQIYPPGFDLLPNKYRDGIESNLERFLNKMEMPYPLEWTNLETPPYSTGPPVE